MYNNTEDLSVLSTYRDDDEPPDVMRPKRKRLSNNHRGMYIHALQVINQ